MKIVKPLFSVLFALFMLYVLTTILENPHKQFYNSDDTFIFSEGNAPDSVRTEIIQLLTKFQNGYTKRDTTQLKPFMEELFAENILILGTMPQEVCAGRKEARRLVYWDWRGWGDCTFRVKDANVSSFENVAWISTIGYVDMDLSRFLTLPLRLSAVAVKENNEWKFQYMQFQFDLDLTYVLVAIVITLIWSLVSLIKLITVIVLFVRKTKK
ncbi:nuclear transport factor 2 family protein [Bacteroidota bacterium]